MSRSIFAVLAAALSASFTLAAYAAQGPNTQTAWAQTCQDNDGWDTPGPAFRVFANTYYVGTCGISAILIAGNAGHILIDGGTERGAELVAANIKALGYDLAEVKILLHSHEHLDHVGGLAALQRLTGAKLFASAAAAPVLASGTAATSDPQFGALDPFPPAQVAAIVKDGEVVSLGDIALKAIATPGHTEGALTWQWRSCADGRCETIVYADSLSPVSADTYRFSDHAAYVKAYRRSLKKLAGLECTLVLTPHPAASGLPGRLAKGRLSDPQACANYAAAVGKRLEERLLKERAVR